MKAQVNTNWDIVRTQNPTYWPGALSEAEGGLIKWHSPRSPHSSQVFCISAFGTLRGLPDRDAILASLFAGILPPSAMRSTWSLVPEHTDPLLLGETGQGTPTSVDVFCRASDAAVCIESKFRSDAKEGFGGCGQAKSGDCKGFYGQDSNSKTKADAMCRLTTKDGEREPRKYWEIGRAFFLESVFTPQTAGQTCPFSGASFQLMRNFLFAARAAGTGKAFGVVCVVPEKMAAKCRKQVAVFKAEVLRPEFRSAIAVVTYDDLVALLARSPYEASRALGGFLQERMSALL